MGLAIAVAPFREYDGVVGIGEKADFTTLQAADDQLDAGAYSLYVKQATYAAGLTVSTNNAHIYCEPGTVIEAAIILSGDDVTLKLGAGCDIQGILTMSGNNVSVLCENGCDLDRTILSGNFGYLNGGGWGTVCLTTSDEAIQVTGEDCIVENIAAHTATGGSASDAVEVPAGAVRNVIKNVKVIDSDSRGIHARGAQGLVEGCLILGSDSDGIRVDAVEYRIIGNQVIAAGTDGIHISAGGDNSVINNNIVKDHGAQAIDILADAEDCTIVGNRVDDLGTSNGVVDNSGTSTAAGNEETAF
jgi:hypothetical protein